MRIFGRKTRQRLNYYRPFHNKALDKPVGVTEVKPETKEDINLSRCLECSELKIRCGVLRCYRDKCKYEVSK